MKVTVIIPFFNKSSDELLRCLDGLDKQIILPEKVIIVSDKHSNLPSYNFNIETETIKKPISIATALNAGLKYASSEIVCFTDPDTMPYEDWIKKIMQAYQTDQNIGGVGGRDELFKHNKLVNAKQVKSIGKLTFYGRLIGNHHEILTSPQEVHFFKGSNMSFRRGLIKNFDEHIAGFYWWEQPVCFRIKANGYKLIFHPGIKVKHFKYNEKNITECSLFVHSKNTTYLLLKYTSLIRKIIFLFYTFFIGQTHNPGILKAILTLGSPNIIGRFSASLRGKVQGIKLFLSTRKEA